MDTILTLSYLLIVIGLLIYFFNKKFFNSIDTTENQNDSGKFLKRLPGPFCLPLIGHVQLFFKKEPNKYLAELAAVYGDIFQLQIGVKTVIVLSSLDAIKEAFQEWEFAGRPHFPSFDALMKASHNPRFAFLNYGNQWKFLRKNAIKALGSFASSKSSRLQKLVDEAAESFTKDICQHLDQPFNPKKSIGECVAAIIGSINFGGQFSRNDPLILKLVELTDVVGRFFRLGAIMDYFPYGAWLMRPKINKFIQNIQPMFSFTVRHIRSHQYNDNITDVADALYARRQELTQEELDNTGLTSENVQMLSQDLFAAGFATTLETFNWCLALMAKFPDVQKRVADEILNAMSSNNDEPLTLFDARKTPYTEAVLLEVFRFSSLIPLNLPHYTVSAKAFRGYYIPKDAVVISNLWKIHYDPNVFERPNEFDPTRFLNSDGTLDMDMSQNIAPFSVGKRRCAGENLARQELYLLLVKTICKFRISMVPGQDIDVYNADPGFTRRVFEHDLIFSLRQ